jgi:hypothetical protein
MVLEAEPPKIMFRFSESRRLSAHQGGKAEIRLTCSMQLQGNEDFYQ